IEDELNGADTTLRKAGLAPRRKDAEGNPTPFRPLRCVVSIPVPATVSREELLSSYVKQGMRQFFKRKREAAAAGAGPATLAAPGRERLNQCIQVFKEPMALAIQSTVPTPIRMRSPLALGF